ncbi:MAG: CheY-P phosphatase CheC [Anaerolineae bacterium]|nr:CheY-P phosphatase CheC [Anaerolineae bacterium]
MTMMIDTKALNWEKLGNSEKFMDLLDSAIQNVARGLTEMVGRTITIETTNIESLSIGHLPSWLGNPEAEMVGVYLLIDGDIAGQVILILALAEALHLIDLLLGEPDGTTTELDDLGRSALAETGNLATSYFLNEMAKRTGTELRPSPPAVMVDMLGAIFNVISAPVAAVSDQLMIVEAEFREPDRTVTAHFWVMPYPVEE